MQNSKPKPKPVIFLHGQIKSPPLTLKARVKFGQLLRQLQNGALLGMPRSRPMPSIGARFHELRVNDRDTTWRVVYRLDSDAVVIAEVFQKQTEETPLSVIRNSQDRLATYDAAKPP